MIPPFERTARIRGYEVDDSRTTPLPVVFSFLEQLRWEWMADPAWGLAEQIHAGHFFVVRRQQVELVERPRFGDAVRITGAIEKVGRSQVHIVHRLFVDDRVVGHARVLGVWLGPNRRLARLPDAARALGREQAAQDEPLGVLPQIAIPCDGAAPSFLKAPRRLFAPRGLDLDVQGTFEPEAEDTLVVRASDCDVFEHVNASTWLHYCNDVRKRAGLRGTANRALLDYRKEALEGETLTVGWAYADRGLVFSIRRDDDIVCMARMDGDDGFGTRTPV